MRIFIRTIPILTFIFFWQNVSAQLPGQKIFSLQEDNRPLTINCIFKSNNGFIYTGTNTGLFRFDGENFNKIYFKNKDYNDTVTAIAQDADQLIWAGFKSGRLARVINDQLTFYDPEEGTPSKRISAICFDSQNNLWYAAYGEGIYQRLNKRHYLLNAENGLPDLNINSLNKTITGEVLAASDQGLIICPPYAASRKVKVMGPANGLPDYIVNTIKPAGNNQFWIGLQDKGFCLYDHTNKKIVNLPAANNWSYGEINDLLQDGNDLWIATQDKGLLRYDLKNRSLHEQSVTGFNDVHEILKDIQGNLWLSNHQHSLINLKAGNLSIYPYPINNLYDKIHAVLFDSRGNIWVGEDQGVYQFVAGSFPSKSTRIAIPVDFATDISALYEDAHGNIWIGTMGKGVFIYDPFNNKLRHLSEAPGFANASILSISGKNNMLYVCSLQGALSVQLTENVLSKAAPYQFIPLNDVNDNTHFIYSIFQDSRNRLWYATDGDGLWMQAADGKLQQYGERENISDEHIYSITEDSTGNIWFSTASSGIYKYDGKTFVNFGLKEGISDLYISVIKTLGSGNIAIVNKNGIDIIEPSTGRISYLASSKGIGSINADNLGAVSIDSSGRILVAGEKGIIAYDVPMASSQHPQTIIQSITLFENVIDKNKQVFDHDENNFTFNFVGLYFSDPSAVYYQYKLEGLDSNWVNTRDRSQTFPKLGPGKYSFRVRSSLNKNFNNASEASFDFTIKTAFYKTSWFMLAVGLLLALVLFAYIRSRENQLKKMQQLQNEKMQFRFEVLRNQVNPHFLFNSFNTLISTIEEDPKMAVEYTEQLSDFFRHIVSYRDKDTILLAEELELLYTYFFLQQKRYGDALQMKVNISEAEASSFQIPPLTLQLLLENAIKHNAVSKDSPLLIEIDFFKPDLLTVKNKINKRVILQAGAGLGLQNIQNRFMLLTNRSVIIENAGNYFLIKLPLVSHGSV